MEVEADKVRQLIKRETTQKQKKEGLSKLDVLLDSAEFKHVLDVNTAKLWPEDQLRAATWPGLVEVYLRHLEGELERGVATSSNAAMRLFKKLMAAAEDGSRTGRPSACLLRRAARLFEFIHKALAGSQDGEVQPLAPLTGSHGQELSQLLLKQLLPNTTYCQCSNSIVFSGIMDAVMSRLETLMGVPTPGAPPTTSYPGGGGGSGGAAGPSAAGGSSERRGPMGEELPRLAQLFALLLAQVPGRLAPEFAADTLAFLHVALEWCDGRGDTGRVALAVLSACCTLLQGYGQELRPHLAKLQVVGQKYTRRSWVAAGRYPRLKELLLRYSRLMLQLEGVAGVGPGAVAELQQLLVEEVAAPGYTWDAPSSRSDGLLLLPAGALPAAMAAAAATAYQQQRYPAVDPEQHPPHLETAGGAAAGVAGKGGVSVADRRRSRSQSMEVGASAGAADYPEQVPATHSTAAAAAAADEGQGRGRRRSASAGDQGQQQDEDGLEGLERPAKRSKLVPGEQQLLVWLELQPARWGPVAALLLRLHAAQLPPSFVAQLLGTCSTSLTRLLTNSASSTTPGQLLGRAASIPADGGAAAGAGTAGGARISSSGSGGGRVASPTPGAGDGAGGSTSAAAVWLLRVLYELAAAWPAVACAPNTTTTTSPNSSTWQESARGGDSSMPASQAWQQQWQRVWSLVEASSAGLVRQLSEDQSNGGQTEPAAANAGGHPTSAAAAAAAHLWLMSALVQQQLLPAQQLLQIRLSVAQTLLPLLQAAAETTAGGRDAGRAGVLEAGCGLLVALYGCMDLVSCGAGAGSSSSSWAGTSPQEQAVAVQLLQTLVQLVTASAAAATADGTVKAGHRSGASGLPTLLVPLIEILSSCPAVSAGMASTPAAAAAAALDAPRGCHQFITRFPSGARKLPLVRLPLEALQLDLGGAAAGAGWWLGDAAVTRQECDMFDLQPGVVQLSWFRFESQQQQLAAGQHHQQQQKHHASGSSLAGGVVAAIPVQGATGHMGVGGGAGWWAAADAAARSVLQALDEVSNTIITTGQAAGGPGGVNPNPTSITQQLEVLCTATAAATSLAAAAALQQLQDLQRLLLPGRQQSNQGQSQSQGGGLVPGGQLLVEVLGGVTSGLALVPNLLQALLQGPLTGLTHSWLHPLTTTASHLSCLQRLLQQAGQQVAAGSGAAAAAYAAAVAEQQQAAGNVVGRAVDILTCAGEAVARALTAAAAAAAAPFDSVVTRGGGQRRGLDLDDDLDLGPEPSSLVTVAPGATSHAGGTQAAASGRLPPGAFAHPGGVAHGGSTGSTAASSSAFKRYSINGYVDPVELLGLEVFAAVAAAVPEAVAGGVLQLWRHMHRLPGAAPSEALLQLMAATTATAVAAGAWHQTAHLLLMCDAERGLLRARAATLPVLETVLQLLETLAVAARSAGVDLNQPLSAAGVEEGSQQQAAGTVLQHHQHQQQGRRRCGPLTGAYDLMAGAEGGGSQQQLPDDPLPEAMQARSVLQLLQEVLLDAHTRLTSARSKLKPELGDQLPLSLQLAQARATAAVALLQPQLFASPSSPLQPLTAELLGLTGCTSYAMRAAVGDLLQVLTKHGVLAGGSLTLVKPHLLLQLPGSMQADLEQQALQQQPMPLAGQHAQYAETAVGMLVKLGAVAVDQEPEALLLMCCHAALSAAAPATGGSSSALQPPLALLQASWGAMAAARGVPNARPGYLTVHIPHLAWHGFEHGLGTDQWLLLRPAVMGPGATDADLLQALTPALLPAILAAQDQPSLERLASLQGQQPGDLLQQQFGAVFGALYPCMAVPEQVTMAQEALGGGLISGCMEPEQQTKELSRQMLTIVSTMLRLAQAPSPGTSFAAAAAATGGGEEASGVQLPYHAPGVFATAINLMPGKGEAAANEAALWRLLPPHLLQQLLLACHSHISAVADPAYQQQRLGAVQAVLQLLNVRAVQPAHVRYACSMLLQLLDKRELQPVCCGMLQQLWGLLLEAATQSNVAQAVAGAFDQEAAAVVQQSQELLQLLLPQVVAAGAKALQSEAVHQLQQWRSQQWLSPTWAIAGVTDTSSSSSSSSSSSGTPVVQPFDLPVNHPVVALLQQVVLQLPPQIHHVLQAVDPLLDMPVLQQAVQLQQQVLQRLTLAERIASLADTADTMAPDSRAQAVQQLWSLLQHQEDQLYVDSSTTVNPGHPNAPLYDPDTRMLCFPAAAAAAAAAAGGAHNNSSSSGGGSQSMQQGSTQRQLQPAVQCAAWRLGQLAGQLQDTGLAAVAGRLLAAAGPLPGHVIVFNPPTAEGGDSGAAAAAGGGESGADSKPAPADAKASSKSKRGAAPAAAAPAGNDNPAAATPGTVQSLLPTILQSLGDCLVSPDPRVVAVAQSVTTQLLATPEGSAALTALSSTGVGSQQGRSGTTGAGRMCGSLLQVVLQTYQHHSHHHHRKHATAAAAVGDGPTAAAQPTDAALWAASGQPYSPWVKHLTSVLLSSCQGSELLQVLSPAAELSDSLAEVLLPHALHHLCVNSSKKSSSKDSQSPDQSTLAQQLGDCVSFGVLQPAVQQYRHLAAGSGGSSSSSTAVAVSNSSTAAGQSGQTVDTRCVLVVLQALEHLRCVHRQSVASEGKGNKPIAAQWPKVYCLPLDYLQVAAAAMAGSAYFMALLYIEHWAEEQYGALQLVNASGQPSTALATAAAGSNAGGSLVAQLQHWRSQQQQVNPSGLNLTGQSAGQQQDLLERLLLDFYAHVNEPDGLYAVAAAFGGRSSRLQLAKHEGQWSTVVSSQDQVLQAGGSAAAAAAGASSVGEAEGLAKVNLLQGLQRLGCLHTAQRYLSGSTLTSQPSASGQPVQLSDLQLQLAWRLADWDQVGTGSSSTVLGGTGLTKATSAAGDVMVQSAGVLQYQQQVVSFNGALLVLLQQLASGQAEGFQSILQTTCLAALSGLTKAGQQSAAAVNPGLLQLQMLEMLRRAWSLRWQQQQQVQIPGSNHSSSMASPMEVDGAAAAAPVTLQPTEDLLFELLKGCNMSPTELGSSSSSSWSTAGQRTAGVVPPSTTALASYDYSQVDQVLSLQTALLQVLHRPDALAATLSATAATARKAGQHPQAAAALTRLSTLLANASSSQPPSTAGGAAASLAGGSSGGGSGGGSSGWLVAATSPEAPWVLESCKLLWARGEQVAALQELQALVATLESRHAAALTSSTSTVTSSTARQLARGLALSGKWSAASQCGSSASEVMRTMLRAQELLVDPGKTPQQAAAAAGGGGGGGGGGAGGDRTEEDALACRVCYRLAAYADGRYRDVTAQMQTPEFRKQRAVIAAKQAHFDELSRRAAEGWAGLPEQEARRGRHKQVQLKKVIDADGSSIRALTDMQSRCLTIALTNYIRALQLGHLYDLPIVYRLCQLWFELSTSDAVNRCMQYAFDCVAPAKFVPLTYQIASRISRGQDKAGFQKAVWTALTRLAVAHPFHTCYSLIALSNGNLGPQGRPQQAAASGGQALQQQVDLDKVEAAATLLQSLRKQPRLGVLLGEMGLLVGAYIDLGAIPVAKNPKTGAVNPLPFPASIRRSLVGHLDHIPLITQQIEVDPSAAYEGVPHLVDIGSTIAFAGGVNAPKVVRVTDSSGRQQRQLVKSGSDDLRQDAVMQQFFSLVTSLLAADPSTARRRLGMSGYKVVPCSPSAGVVEWVDHTLPCIDYLAGASRTAGAHGRYWRSGSGNLTWMQAYTTMQSCKPEKLLETFTSVTRKFPPVLHHFFLENVTAPAAWFQARTHYTRAMAVSCMAGYIIGLGDRHFGNILLDLRTAGVVQIDLGVAFEQGQFLPTPERVPFRLTRDVVDGMGAGGVEGPMRRCCEETMKVLRAHREALLTVIEVVLHDPLYNWQMTPVRARRRQQQQQDAELGLGEAEEDEAGGSGSGGASGGGGSSSATQLRNADAERVVLRVKQKLEGLDGGEGEPRGVAGQVAALLAEAQDPERLARMYVGWAAWM